MDECSPICKPKKQKLNEEEETEEGSKSISNLPDAVLHYILSLLPTKDTVRTSVLSKRFPNEHSTQQLFSGCPVLKELELNYCDWVNLRVLSISAPRLLRLILLEFDTIDSSYTDGCQVMIFGTRINFFHYIGDFWNEYCFSNTSSLEVACIHTDHWDHRPRQVAYRMYKLLTVLPGVNLLALSSQALQGITLSTECEKDGAILDAVPPCFLSHLTRILVQMYGGTEKDLQAVKILLKNAVVLNKMSISYLEPFPGGLEKQKVRQQLLELPRGSKSWEVEF